MGIGALHERNPGGTWEANPGDPPGERRVVESEALVSNPYPFRKSDLLEIRNPKSESRMKSETRTRFSHKASVYRRTKSSRKDSRNRRRWREERDAGAGEAFGLRLSFLALFRL